MFVVFPEPPMVIKSAMAQYSSPLLRLCIYFGLDMADFGFRRKRAFDRIARAEFGGERLGVRSELRPDYQSPDFGFRKNEHELIDELAIAIAAMGRASPVAEPVRPSVDEEK
ncbi:hypothetical protein OSTOST_14880 [Ostertagia ostertagi]